jgi:hypothetical protein
LSPCGGTIFGFFEGGKAIGKLDGSVDSCVSTAGHRPAATISSVMEGAPNSMKHPRTALMPLRNARRPCSILKPMNAMASTAITMPSWPVRTFWTQPTALTRLLSAAGLADEKEGFGAMSESLAGMGLRTITSDSAATGRPRSPFLLGVE